MGRLSGALRNRLVPALLTATGVSLIAAGLLTYSGSAIAGPLPTASPTASPVNPTPAPTLPTFAPASQTPSSSISPTPVADRVATRVVVEALGIDLPVIRPIGGPDAYPQCDVAMYIQQLGQPGQDRATYIYAHARDGMFGPIYERAILRRNGGPSSMLGMLVEVYTSDNKLFTYQVAEVRLDQRTLDDAVDVTSEQLWLQTSEGPRGTPGKTQLIATPLTIADADPVAAHPEPRPVNCE